MMKIEDQIRNEIHKVLVTTFDEVEIREDQIVIEKPNDSAHGDFSTNIAMRLAGQLKKNPLEIAEAIKEHTLKQVQGDNSSVIDEVDVAGPGFINFFINKSVFQNEILNVLKAKENYGKKQVKEGKTVLIEHTSPNPTKEFHLGHLKTHVIGIALAEMNRFEGAKVYTDMIDNNRGIAIARLMWGYLNFSKKDNSLPTDLEYWFDHKDQWKTPSEEGVSPGKFVDKLYTKASEEFKKSEDVEKAVRQLVIDWEAEDEKNLELWSLTQKWVWEGFEKVLKRINGWNFDKVWHEHELYKNGKGHVERGVEEGFFKKLEDGAILTDFEKQFGISDTILIKRDGTSLYITQDLELTHLKREKFNPDEMNWVIGPEQSLAMKQMFAACAQLGFGKYEDFHHIPYGFILVEGEDGSPQKMSSRDGTQISVDDLIDRARDEILKKIDNDEIKESEAKEVAEKIAVGSIKYSLLKVSRTQDQVFSFEKTISLEGDSGPYILYSYARAKAILRKMDESYEDFDSRLLKEDFEVELTSLFLEFPNTAEKALRDNAPHYISQYVYNLAQNFNHFYNSSNIQNSEPELKKARLALTAATAQVIKNALYLLGIETVEKM